MVRGVMTLQIPRANTSSIRNLLLPALLLAMCSFANADSGVLADLVGAWIRPDGGYKLVVKSIGKDGKALVEYFNPNPIPVAEATASLKDGWPELFVKLEGVNYTGSTYQLTLGADKNQLQGKYFQSTQKQTYEIFFERQPEKKGEPEPPAR